MLTMPVTLDVLKFSGWLNFRAICRVERRTLNSLVQEGVWGSGSATRQRACGGLDCVGRFGAGHVGGERTENISSMVVTLDVSKLTGWLNLCATCRVERRACAMTGKVRLGRQEGGG